MYKYFDFGVLKYDAYFKYYFLSTFKNGSKLVQFSSKIVQFSSDVVQFIKQLSLYYSAVQCSLVQCSSVFGSAMQFGLFRPTLMITTTTTTIVICAHQGKWFFSLKSSCLNWNGLRDRGGGHDIRCFLGATENDRRNR